MIEDEVWLVLVYLPAKVLLVLIQIVGYVSASIFETFFSEILVCKGIEGYTRSDSVTSLVDVLIRMNTRCFTCLSASFPHSFTCSSTNYLLHVIFFSDSCHCETGTYQWVIFLMWCLCSPISFKVVDHILYLSFLEIDCYLEIDLDTLSQPGWDSVSP